MLDDELLQALIALVERQGGTMEVSTAELEATVQAKKYLVLESFSEKLVLHTMTLEQYDAWGAKRAKVVR